MKCSLFGNSKCVEIDDELIQMHETYVYPVDSVVLEGITVACGAENSNEREMEIVLAKSLVGNLEIVVDKEDVITKIQELLKHDNLVLTTI